MGSTPLFKIIFTGLIVFSLIAPAAAWSKTYQISAADSSVDFEVTHQIGFTTGIIPIGEGTIDADEHASGGLATVIGDLSR